MDAIFRRGRDKVTPIALDAAIEALNSAKDTSSIRPAKSIFIAVGLVLATIRVGFPSACVGRPLANLSRNRWPTGRSMSNWGYPVPMSVGPSSRERTVGKKISSLRLSSKQLNNWKRELKQRRWILCQTCSPWGRSQDCSGDPVERHQGGQTKHYHSPFPREEGQRHDR